MGSLDSMYLLLVIHFNKLRKFPTCEMAHSDAFGYIIDRFCINSFFNVEWTSD